MSYISKIQIKTGNEQDNYLIEPQLYITPLQTETSLSDNTLTDFALEKGVQVQMKLGANAPANATLKISNTDAKPIYYNGAAIQADQLLANRTYNLVYDGNYWQVVGDLDTNTWRGIENSLTSDSTTDSLSAKQGKVLKGLIDAMDASTPDASGNATAFIDSITQTDGKITSITKKNIPTVSKDTAGLVPKGAAVIAQSTSTQFLREDGQWAVPSYIADTHHTAHLITGASATATTNAAGDTNSIFLNLIENSSVRNSHNIIGAGSVTVASDANGNITITGDTYKSSGSANALTSLKLKYTDSSAHDNAVGRSSSAATALGTVTDGVLYIKSLYYGITSVSTGVTTG